MEYRPVPRQGIRADRRRRNRIRTREDALHRAIELERATLGYYQALRDVVGASDALDGIIRAEREHLIRVTQQLHQSD